MKLIYGNDYYDKIQPLVDGQVRVEGIEISPVFCPANELFLRVLKSSEFDLAEMSLTSFLVARSNVSDFPYLALPVFPIRKFFHTDILCQANSGIRQPADLRGKRFGVPEYQTSLSIWTRAALERDFGVPPAQIEWVEAHRETRNQVLGLHAPATVHISKAPRDQNLSRMLLSGMIDAAIGVDLQALHASSGSSGIRPLFDYRGESIRFFAQHGYIPANHIVVLMRDLAERYRDLPTRLYGAFEASKAQYYQKLAQSVASAYRNGDVARNTGVLWLRQVVQEQEALFGPDPSPYGFRANRGMIEDCVQALTSQEFLSAPLEVESVFAETLLET